MTKKYFLFLSIFFTLLLATHVPVARAQDAPIGLSISPPLDVVDIGDRDHLTLAFTVENISNQDMIITPSVRSFHADQESGAVVLDQNSFPTYISVQTPGFALRTPFFLPSGKQQQLVLSITIPPALMRDLTLTFLAEGKPTTQGHIGEGASTSIRTTVGANMILRIRGGSNATDILTLEQLHAPSVVDIFSSVELGLRAHNNDVTTHQVRGTLTLSRGGSIISTYAFSPDMILPGSSRNLRFVREKDGDKEPITTEVMGPFIPGQYTATVSLASEEGSVHSYSTTILILPISLFLVFLAMGLLTSIGFFAFKKKKSQEI